ncbi:hypothetical protein [Pseudomonas sp. Irchel 3E20]|uniref:hypothetical protein n=1 Tax=Pseudomonas sp. Irchel 3E20 TaxID=2008983 RepID=UPI000BA30322|nr:hypothetical protein [Pseudomonas sp. Irchel 3E20]
MGFLSSWFNARRPQRCFARLDRRGHCQAFKQCSLPPAGDNWVEIREIRLNWLQGPLPASARVSARTCDSWRTQALAS